jgi:hypothetical protein
MSQDSKHIEIPAVQNGIRIMRFRDLGAAVQRDDKIEKLGDELFSVLNQGPVTLILDFEGKEFLPVAAFEGKLVALHRKLSGRLILCNLPPLVIECFNVNRLASLFHICATLSDALAVANRDPRENVEATELQG